MAQFVDRVGSRSPPSAIVRSEPSREFDRQEDVGRSGVGAPQSHSFAGQPIQRQVRVQGDATYRADSVEEGDAAGLRAMKTAAETHLMLSREHYDRLSAGDPRGVRRLTPDKHLIGETHAVSRFQEAAADWGFGAQQMREALSDNDRLKHLAGDRARADRGSVNYGSLPLEDTVAKNLTTLAGARYLYGQLHQHATVLADPLAWSQADAVVTGAIATLSRAVLADTVAVSSVTDNLIDYVLRAPSYLSRFKLRGANDPAWAATSELKATITARDFASSFEAASVQLRAQVAPQNASFHLSAATLQRVVGFLDRLIASVEAIHAQQQPVLHAQLQVHTEVESTKAQDVDPLNPLREHYMGRNIRNNLGRPGLVKVGSHHLAGLGQQAIPHAILHDDYADFLRHTELTGAAFWNPDLKRRVDFERAITSLEAGIADGDAQTLLPFIAAMRAAWNEMAAQERRGVRSRILGALDRYCMTIQRRRPSQDAMADQFRFPGLTASR